MHFSTMKRERLPHCWPFVRGIWPLPMDSLYRHQWCIFLSSAEICCSTTIILVAGDFRRREAFVTSWCSLSFELRLHAPIDLPLYARLINRHISRNTQINTTFNLIFFAENGLCTIFALWMWKWTLAYCPGRWSTYFYHEINSLVYQQ